MNDPMTLPPMSPQEAGMMANGVRWQKAQSRPTIAGRAVPFGMRCRVLRAVEGDGASGGPTRKQHRDRLRSLQLKNNGAPKETHPNHGKELA